MRILFTRFPLESTYGGAEVQTLSLMKGLRERGHEVGFLGSCPVLLEKVLGFPTYARASVGGQFSAFSLDIGKPPVAKWSAISFLWRQHAMRRALIAQMSICSPPPSALCMLSLSEKLLLTDWAVAHGIRVFWIEHDRVGRWLQWNPWLPRLRRLGRLATTIVVSDLSKSIYVELGWNPERIVVIPNGIDLGRFCVMDRRAQGDTLRIGCIARLSPEKGVDLLIAAIKDLPNVHLTVVGTGRDERKIHALIRHLQLEQRVTIQRAVNNVADFYRSFDLFVLPSRDHDPCPLVPMEAMACGVPVIMTDACGTAEYVENGTEAIVVPAGSAEALREAIKRTTNDEQRATLRQYGLEAARKKFSLERMVEEYESLLGQIPSPIGRGQG